MAQDRNDLTEARRKIEEIDRKMADLFCQRMALAPTIASFKQAHGLPVKDKEREAQLIEKNASKIENDEYRSYYISFLKNVMHLSRSYQHKLLDGAKIAYSGIEGSFAAIAVKKIFPDGNPISCPDFKSAYKAVEKGDCDCAVLPIENSYAGEVGQVLDLLCSGTLYVTGVYDLPVTQNLLGIPGAKRSDIETVISHQQALNQCADYLREQGFETLQATNTAVAAQKVAQENNIHLAAIASEDTAMLYGLDIIEKNINESDTNTTRFAVFTRSENPGKSNQSILLFTVDHKAGSLAKALNIIGKYGYNMRVLRSRPVLGEIWKYYFYIELEGDLNSDDGKDMLEEMGTFCGKIKVAGTFDAEQKLK